MQLEKKIIKIQIVINILFLLLSINLILGSIITNDLYKYISLGLFVLLFIVFALVFRNMESEKTKVNSKYIQVVKYNAYAFLLFYATIALTMSDNLFSIKGIVFLSLLFITTIFGIVFNSIIYVKSR